MVLGSHMTDRTKAKQSAAHMGHIASLETRAKMSVANKGRIKSPETLAKMSAAGMGNTHCLGHYPSLETRAKISAAHKGHAISQETRRKLSAAKWKGGRPISKRKENAKRRTLGFNPLNSYFVGCEGHHINPQDVIHLPKTLHRSIRHNQYTGLGMAEMNVLAGKFLTEDWT